MSDHYVKNPAGGIVVVSDEVYADQATTLIEGGRRVLQPGWEDLTEEQARQLHPRLFGLADGRVERFKTAAMRAEELERQRVISEADAAEKASIEKAQKAGK